MEDKKLSAEQPAKEKQTQEIKSEETTPVQEKKPTTKQKEDKKKEPLSKQSKEIMFGLLGGFSLIVAIVCFVLMFIF